MIGFAPKITAQDFEARRGSNASLPENFVTYWFRPALVTCQAEDETFPSITPHDLRHTAVSLAVSVGANVKALQRMVGHAKASMTLDTYADLFEEDLDDVADRLDAATRTTADNRHRLSFYNAPTGNNWWS